MERRLCKSYRNKKLAGVCGGIGEYFNIDPTIVRIIGLIIAFCYGSGLLIYIIAAILIPDAEEADCEYKDRNRDGYTDREFGEYKENESY